MFSSQLAIVCRDSLKPWQLNSCSRRYSGEYMTNFCAARYATASAEAVAYLATQKFVMYSPLYRLEQEFNRQGLKLSRQTMANWLLNTSEKWLQPIYDTLREQLCKEPVLHADETTLQVLKEPGRSSTSKSYMWLYRTSGCAKQAVVLYEYQPTRKAEHAEAFLQGFNG